MNGWQPGTGPGQGGVTLPGNPVPAPQTSGAAIGNLANATGRKRKGPMTVQDWAAAKQAQQQQPDDGGDEP